MILGLDSSTKCTGYSFIEAGVVVSAGFIDTSKCLTNKEKTYKVIEELEKNPLTSKIDHVNLEGAINGFASKSTILLARFNAVHEYIISERWGKPVKLLNVNSARKRVLGKARVKGMKAKQLVAALLPSIVPNLKEFEVLNNRNVPDKRMEDVWDAIVIGLYE